MSSYLRVREHQLNTLDQLEAAWLRQVTSGQFDTARETNRRIMRLQHDLGLCGLFAEADREAEDAERAEQGFRMFQGGQ